MLQLLETAKQTKVCLNILFADAKRRHGRNKQLLNSTCPLTTHPRELQKVATAEVWVQSIKAVH